MAESIDNHGFKSNNCKKIEYVVTWHAMRSGVTSKA